ncbi:MAG: RsmB/NOP family class I SAM-dependent RNA methyltransferase [Planctomycetota bacterium]
MELPAEFIARLRDIIAPEDWDVVSESFSATRAPAFRVNTLRAAPEQLLADLAAAGISASPVAWSETAFVIPHNQRELLTHSAAAESGQLYVQSLSSQLAALILQPQPGEMILDLAAAPGGKTSHLAALMQNQGWVSAVEPIRDRFFRLQANLKRLGVTIGHFYQIDGRIASRKTGPRFDRVLLDAPCSAESRFRAGQPESFQFWSTRKIRESSRKQAGLIRSAFEALKPGGKLLYCTCTFAPEENEAIVAGLLEEFPDSASLLELPAWLPSCRPGLSSFAGTNFPAACELTRRIVPSQQHDAFFFALIEKHSAD